MLVLTRKHGEGINIGKNIVVRVLDVHGGHVKIGIEAPQDLAIYREEIFVKILAENRIAANPDPKTIERIFSSFKGFIIKEEPDCGN
ncbi:MAG: carbon storage regulator CsrA [Nitrospinota bacterium]